MENRREESIKILAIAIELLTKYHDLQKTGIEFELLLIKGHNLFDIVVDQLGFLKDGTAYTKDGQEGTLSRDYLMDFFTGEGENMTANQLYDALLVQRAEEDQLKNEFKIIS